MKYKLLTLPVEYLFVKNLDNGKEIFFDSYVEADHFVSIHPEENLVIGADIVSTLENMKVD